MIEAVDKHGIIMPLTQLEIKIKTKKGFMCARKPQDTGPILHNCEFEIGPIQVAALIIGQPIKTERQKAYLLGNPAPPKPESKPKD